MQKSRGYASHLFMLYRLLLNGSGALMALAFLFFAVNEARAQEAEQAVLQEAFSTGNARAVLQDASGRVEVGLFGSSSQYSRSQAVYVLQKFFEDYPPRRFVWKRTSANGRSHFMAGRYWHEAAERPVRVYVRLANSGDGWQLQEVRIERR